MYAGMPPMANSRSAEALLPDPHTCRRIIWALKAGRPPREGVRFLSVGMESVLEQVNAVLERAAMGRKVTPLVVQGDYGEGKSHTLRVIAEEARARGFSWVVITHDRQQNVGLHKPAWLLRRILWELQWNYPNIDLAPWESRMNSEPSYNTDCVMRVQFSSCVRDLANDLRSQGFRGLVLCIDELENYTLLASRQKPIFKELAKRLSSGEPGVVFLFAMTYGLKIPCVWGHRISPPQLDQAAAVALAERIQQLHSVAFRWEPRTSPERLAEVAWKRAVSAQSGRWRVFVQSAVTLLEIAYQSEHPTARRRPIHAAAKTSMPARDAALPPPLQDAAAAVRPALHEPVALPQRNRPKVQVGDWVTILGGHFSGWNGRVQAISGERITVMIEGGMSVRVQLHVSQVRRVRP